MIFLLLIMLNYVNGFTNDYDWDTELTECCAKWCPKSIVDPNIHNNIEHVATVGLGFQLSTGPACFCGIPKVVEHYCWNHPDRADPNCQTRYESQGEMMQRIDRSNIAVWNIHRYMNVHSFWSAWGAPGAPQYNNIVHHSGSTLTRTDYSDLSNIRTFTYYDPANGMGPECLGDNWTVEPTKAPTNKPTFEPVPTREEMLKKFDEMYKRGDDESSSSSSSEDDNASNPSDYEPPDYRQGVDDNDSDINGRPLVYGSDGEIDYRQY